MNHLGFFGTSGSRTVVRIYFTTHQADGAPVAPSSELENDDVRIYQDGSATQRASAAGTTMTSPFDSVTGLHLFEIDLTDDTDPGFYAAYHDYTVVLVPDETIDGVGAITKVLGQFSIGLPEVNVTQVAGGDVEAADEINCNVVKINGTDIGGTGTRVADGFVEFFNVATPGHTLAQAFPPDFVMLDIDDSTGAVVSSEVLGNVGGKVLGGGSGSFGGVGVLAQNEDEHKIPDSDEVVAAIADMVVYTDRLSNTLSFAMAIEHMIVAHGVTDGVGTGSIDATGPDIASPGDPTWSLTVDGNGDRTASTITPSA